MPTTRASFLALSAAVILAVAVVPGPADAAGANAVAAEVRVYPVPEGDGPHDAAAAPDSTIWYSAQAPARWALSTRRPARFGTFRSARARRRTA